MTARTISYILDGLAVKLRDGLKDEGYHLQQAARRLRELGEDCGVNERDQETYEYATEQVVEVMDLLQSLVHELDNARWHIKDAVRPRETDSVAPPGFDYQGDPDAIPF